MLHGLQVANGISSKVRVLQTGAAACTAKTSRQELQWASSNKKESCSMAFRSFEAQAGHSSQWRW